MLRTNLSTRPFYNERGVHGLLGIIAVIVVLLTIFNVTQIVLRSRRQSELSARAGAADTRARDLRERAARMREALDTKQLGQISEEARDKEFKPLDNASVKISVTTVNAASAAPDTIRLNAEPALSEAGLYEAQYVPRSTGGYLAQATVADADGVEVGQAQAGWSADPTAEEFKSLKPNRALLENIARQTGGELISLNNLAAFADKLPSLGAPVTETVTTPLWHQPLVFLLALACFVSEWGLRRWKGMA